MEKEIFKVLEENNNYSIGSNGTVINNKTGKTMKPQNKGNHIKIDLRNPKMSINLSKMMDKYFPQTINEGVLTKSFTEDSDTMTALLVDKDELEHTLDTKDILLNDYKDKVNELENKIVELESAIKQGENLIELKDNLIERLEDLYAKQNKNYAFIIESLNELNYIVNTASIFNLRKNCLNTLSKIKNIINN